jgi:hypothetical protein
MPFDPKRVPETLEQCFEQLEGMMKQDPEGGERFLETDDRGKDVTYMYHHTLGRWIRNNWGINHSHGKLHEWLTGLGLHHPDDMSGLILTSFWRHKNDKALDIEGQVQHFKDFWDKHEPHPGLTTGEDR